MPDMAAGACADLSLLVHGGEQEQPRHLERHLLVDGREAVDRRQEPLEPGHFSLR